MTFQFWAYTCQKLIHSFQVTYVQKSWYVATKGFIFYYACGLDPYLLNHQRDHFFREPRKFEYLRTLVDGAHWQGQKKLKRPDRSGRGGHLGCSEGFNFNLKEGVLSQGREQMHSRLTKLTSSLCQMNYNSFMIFWKYILP